MTQENTHSLESDKKKDSVQLSEIAEINNYPDITDEEKRPYVPMDIVEPGERFIKTDQFKEYSGSGTRFKNGDILFAKITPCLENGKIGQFISENTDVAWGSTEYFVLRPKNGNVDPDYLYYLCSTNIVRGPAEKSMQGASGRQRVNREVFENIEVPYPPQDKQEKIGAVLASFDKLIENNKRRIDILEEMAETIYREWFVKFNFPGSEEVEMKESKLGEIPKGWKVEMLSEVATINRENLKEETAPDKINYITLSDVSEGEIHNEEEMPWNESPGRARRVVQHKDIIWGSVRPKQESYALIYDPEKNTIVSTGFAVITAEEVPFSYIYQFLTTDRFVEYLANVATGANYPSANVDDYKKATILIPPSPLLNKFDDLTESLFNLKNELKKTNKTLRQIRELLLPRLISGEIVV